MSKHDEVEAALAAFNKVRAEVGGIKTAEQQRYAMNEALDAADRARRGDEPAKVPTAKLPTLIDDDHPS